MLARHSPDKDGDTDREVHLLPLPLSGEAGAASAVCGARLRPDEMETVPPGDGLWCAMCFVSHVTGSCADRAPDSSDGRRSVGVAYRDLGWPVTLRGDQVSLNLDLDVDAVAQVKPRSYTTS